MFFISVPDKHYKNNRLFSLFTKSVITDNAPSLLSKICGRAFIIANIYPRRRRSTAARIASQQSALSS